MEENELRFSLTEGTLFMRADIVHSFAHLADSEMTEAVLKGEYVNIESMNQYTRELLKLLKDK